MVIIQSLTAVNRRGKEEERKKKEEEDRNHRAKI